MNHAMEMEGTLKSNLISSPGFSDEETEAPMN